jgi:hypothetical protein
MLLSLALALWFFFRPSTSFDWGFRAELNEIYTILIGVLFQFVAVWFWGKFLFESVKIYKSGRIVYTTWYGDRINLATESLQRALLVPSLRGDRFSLEVGPESIQFTDTIFASADLIARLESLGVKYLPGGQRGKPLR